MNPRQAIMVESRFFGGLDMTETAELLEVPCIAYAASLDEVSPLARTGADFVALGEWIWTEPQGAAAIVAAAAENLAEPVPR